MKKKILVIGGTRFFGRRLVTGLVNRGNEVTIATRGQAPDEFGDTVRRLRVDRRDRAAMRDAFAEARYDLVYDQMCYSPLDAAISAESFAGKVGRYLMSSTIEVYDAQPLPRWAPFAEDDIDLAAQPVEPGKPWHDPAHADALYGEGKRQAEAFFHQDGRLPVAAVRIGHVLAGPEDFTGRAAGCVALARGEAPLAYSSPFGRSSFIDVPGIVDFLLWAGEQEFLGAVNAASDGALSALDLHACASGLLGRELRARHAPEPVAPGVHSPFDFPAPYVMSTARAAMLGYRFRHSGEWLAPVLAGHLAGEEAGR